ncbi:MAG: GNAT family N-acetyltransferase [Rhodospirillaceae bacterium]|nr:GNAT family N-acetyltransferase [Rhodospirillaceae bacterium]MBT3627725.1 GNAT family N-acetyltransferase [Rhodospirillaceae bacterium]MBT3927094.1 GNAT family N-acetyltransferase [Rhodospirillaceae bacterium]MBT4428360.1 GNAT family N-acetyltransferase [Rhodospirillaceae bacterium]MBT5038821.1 GNAT family N-acetyltransferase [Rhodospirillaceae bacterium]
MKSYDLPSIASLHAICFEDAWHAELLGRILTAPGAFGLFTRPHGKTVGFIICRSTGEEGEILSLAVAPNVRRNGLGGVLLEAAKVQAAKLSIESLFLEVAEDNLAARRLYEKSDFSTVGRRPHYYRRRYGPAVDALTLRCELTP